MPFKRPGHNPSASGPTIPPWLELTPAEIAELEQGGIPPVELDEPYILTGLKLGVKPFLLPAHGGGHFFETEGRRTQRQLQQTLAAWPARMKDGRAWRNRIQWASTASRPGLYYLPPGGGPPAYQGEVRRPLGMEDGLIRSPQAFQFPINTPFLKWPGGKSLLSTMLDQLWPTATRLVEPFTGGGSIFLNTVFDEYLLADTNIALINLYRALQRTPKAAIKDIEALFVPRNNADARFRVLRKQFNTTRSKRERAALFVYLNRHAFNGLVRYNRLGQFNVAFGKFSKPPQCPSDAMRFFADKLKASKVEIKCQDVWQTLAEVRAGDLVYCDPPYLPLTATANFANYGPQSFTLEHQRRLAEEAARLRDTLGVPVLISNHDTLQARQIYQHADQLITGTVRRAISAKGGSRQPAPELIAAYWPTT